MCPYPEKVHPISASVVLTLKLVHLVLSFISLALLKLLPLHWSFEQVSWYTGPLRAAFGLLQTFVFLRCNPCWFSQPNIMGTPLPGTGSLGCGLWCGVGILCSSGGTTAADLSLPSINCRSAVMGPAWSASLPLLPIFCGFFFI